MQHYKLVITILSFQKKGRKTKQKKRENIVFLFSINGTTIYPVAPKARTFDSFLTLFFVLHPTVNPSVYPVSYTFEICLDSNYSSLPPQLSTWLELPSSISWATPGASWFPMPYTGIPYTEHAVPLYPPTVNSPARCQGDPLKM